MTLSSPAVSVIVPLYNAAPYVASTLESIQAQTFGDFEVIIVNDGSTDAGPSIAERFTAADSRFRIVSQKNRGLAGARNTGVENARGEFLAFLDSDDVWTPAKLQEHVRHLRSRNEVGVSYCGSDFIDESGVRIGISQKPKLLNITAEDIFCRNPVGNGSAPVIRRAALDAIEFRDAGAGRRMWFDESFRQSEDIELWCRIAVTTHWKFEGIEGPLTLYRVNASGLSANTDRQLETWLRFKRKLQQIAPALVENSGRRAEAYQLRYLSRRASVSGDGQKSVSLILRALWIFPSMLVEETGKTVLSTVSSFAAWLLPQRTFLFLKSKAFASAGALWS